jgi:hypothetical protein
MHHDAITGTHSLTAKRDYDDRILIAESMLQNIDKYILQDIDSLFKETYGSNKL